MNTGTATAPSALDFNAQETRLTARIDLNRDKTRYVACLGNHLETLDARQVNDVGGWAGGIYIGASEIGGCPTMKRTRFMLLRGLFTPLETTAVGKKADHRENEGHRETFLDGPNIPPGTRGYTVYAGDDLSYLQSDRYRPMGVVELTSLMAVDWNSELRISLQNFFFPDWQLWQKGEGKPPVLLSDWETMVQTAIRNAKYESHEMIGSELMESARLFKNYANNQIEQNRQIIQQMRSVNTGGQYVGWHNKSRMFAEQLGLTLEDEKSIAPGVPETTGLIVELREDRKIREQELQMQKELNAALIAKITGEPLAPVEVKTDVEPQLSPVLDPANNVSFGVSEVVPSAEDLLDPNYADARDFVASADNPDELILAQIERPSGTTNGCSQLNAKGDACRARVWGNSTECAFHGGEKKPEHLK